MIRSAVLKLSLLYLGIVMAICIGFSTLLYSMASVELENELAHPPYVQKMLQGVNFDYDAFREARIEESRSHIKASLFVLNVLTLTIAGGLSYLAARRTLRPIGDALTAQARFASDASHELRTPLAAMKTEIEVTLRDDSIQKKDLHDLLRSNLEEISKLQQLSDGLLRLARQTEHDAEFMPHDVLQIVEPALERIAKAARAKHITFESNFEPAMVRGNLAALTELVFVLLDNAVKYSPENSVITVGAGPNNRRVNIQVSDAGPGIPADKIPDIFKRFYRIDDSRTKHKAVGGYGLGLAIADNIVRQHGGSIKVDSTLNAGSTFTVTLPKL